MSVGVGEYIRERLKENKNGIKTMKELAEKAKINPTYLSRVVKSHIKASPAFLRAIAPHLPGASLQDLMAVAGHLTPNDEPENETIEDLEVRMEDLSSKLSAAMTKYIKVQADKYGNRKAGARMEIDTVQLILKTLSESVRYAQVDIEFRFLEDDESRGLVRTINSLQPEQKAILASVANEINTLNKRAARASYD